MNEHEIAYKYVHGKHYALTDRQEKKDLAKDILNFAKDYHTEQLRLRIVSQQRELVCELEIKSYNCRTFAVNGRTCEGCNHFKQTCG